MQTAIVLTFVIAIGAIGIYLFYEVSLQPNIQVTSIEITPPIKETIKKNVIDLGRVSRSSSFNYNADKTGIYTMVFSNTFSTFSSKSVSVTYSADERSDTQSFKVPPGTIRSIPFALSSGQKIEGSFTVSGGSGNDVNFLIERETGTQNLSFSFKLVNSGSADGYADVNIQAYSKTVWSNAISYIFPEVILRLIRCR